MLIAKIKQRDDGVWYCSECRVRQPCLRETCVFCGSLFTNFEDELVRANKHIEDESTETSYPEGFVEMGRRIVKEELV
jgi:hypothetical protein